MSSTLGIDPAYRADDPHYWYYANIEDPNERGYDAIRRIFLNEIACVVSGADVTAFDREKESTETNSVLDIRPGIYAEL